MNGESHLSALQVGNTVFIMDPAVIEKEALNLTEPERALLADRLLQTLGAEDEKRLPRWVDEAEGRWQAVRDGRLKADDGDAVLARLRAAVCG